MIHHLLKNRPRLLLGLFSGSIVGFLLPNNWLLITRILISWDIAIMIYLPLISWLMLHATHHKVKQLAEQEDRSNASVVLMMSLTVMASFAAIVLDLASSKELSARSHLFHYALTTITLLLSWLFMSVIFTFNYARLYYRSPNNAKPLVFPKSNDDADDIAPNYWEFLYFSFTIAAALQTSDVLVTSRNMRKIVLAHTIISFLFNLAILGLFVNIAASIMSS